MRTYFNSEKRSNFFIARTTITTLAIILIVAATNLATMMIGGELALYHSAEAVDWGDGVAVPTTRPAAAPSVITDENVYIVWWNGTAGIPDAQTDIMFRASNDDGQTFTDKVNLSNTTNSDSWRVEVAAEEEDVIISWWETNQTSDIPVARISNDAGRTFGPLLMLAANVTLSSEEVEEIAGVDEVGEG